MQVETGGCFCFQINSQIKSKITEIDKELGSLRDKVLREPTAKSDDKSKSYKPYVGRDSGERMAVQGKSEETVKVLEEMQL